MKSKVIATVLASSMLLTGIVFGQSGHTQHHPKQGAAKPPTDSCCCMGMMKGTQGDMGGKMSMKGMSGEQKGMMPMDNMSGMMDKMNADDAKFQDLVDQMNSANGDSKLDAAIAVINAMAKERNEMHAMMKSMHGAGSSNPNHAEHHDN